MPRKKKSEMTVADEIKLDDDHKEKESDEKTSNEAISQIEAQDIEEKQEDSSENDENNEEDIKIELKEDDDSDSEENDEEESEDDENEEKEDKRNGFRKRLAAKEQRLKQLEKENARYKLEKELPNILQSNLPPKPQRSDFEDDDQFFEAMYGYRKMQEQTIERLEKNVIAESEVQEKNLHIIENGMRKYNDFEETVEPLLSKSFPTNSGVDQALRESKHGSELLYILGKNYDAAKKIALMSPVQAIKEIYKLELRLEQRKKNAASKAPAPVGKLEKGDSKVSLTKDPSKMNPAEFKKWYADTYKRS